MAFASTQLAAKIEAADRRSLIDAARAAAVRRGDNEVFWREFAGGVGIFIERESPLNKLAGLGFDGLPSSDELSELEELFSARRAKLLEALILHGPYLSLPGGRSLLLLLAGAAAFVASPYLALAKVAPHVLH